MAGQFRPTIYACPLVYTITFTLDLDSPGRTPLPDPLPLLGRDRPSESSLRMQTYLGSRSDGLQLAAVRASRGSKKGHFSGPKVAKTHWRPAFVAETPSKNAALLDLCRRSQEGIDFRWRIQRCAFQAWEVLDRGTCGPAGRPNFGRGGGDVKFSSQSGVDHTSFCFARQMLLTL